MIDERRGKSMKRRKIVVWFFAIAAVVALLVLVAVGHWYRFGKVNCYLDNERDSLLVSHNDSCLNQSEGTSAVGKQRTEESKSKGEPFGCYVSEDSSFVLKIEKIYEDEIGPAYRAFLYSYESGHDSGLRREPIFWGCGSRAEDDSGMFEVLEFVDPNQSMIMSIKGIVMGNSDNIEASLSHVSPSKVEKKTMKFHKRPWEDIVSWEF